MQKWYKDPPLLHFWEIDAIEQSTLAPRTDLTWETHRNNTSQIVVPWKIPNLLLGLSQILPHHCASGLLLLLMQSSFIRLHLSLPGNSLPSRVTPPSFLLTVSLIVACINKAWRTWQYKMLRQLVLQGGGNCVCGHWSDGLLYWMGEGGTPVTVTGSLSHGSQAIVNTSSPLQWSGVKHFLEWHRCQLILGIAGEASAVYSFNFHSFFFCLACIMTSLLKLEQLFSQDWRNASISWSSTGVLFLHCYFVWCDIHQQNLNGYFLLC